MSNDRETQGAVARVESPFGAAEPPNRSVAAVQAQSREVAEIQTKFLMAEKFPRDERACMDRILNSFSRAGLAEVAEYAYSKGGTDISGPSIRAAEAIAQGWGNLDVGWSIVETVIDPFGIPVSTIEARCIDLQARTFKSIRFPVRHWIDKSGGGRKTRDDREVYELCANQAQRRVRACILAQVPGDVIDTAMEQAAATLKSKVDLTPEGLDKLLKAFADFGVTKEHIEKMIQRRFDSIQAGNVVRLKRIFASLRDQMSAPSDWFEMDEQPAGQTVTRGGSAGLKDAAKKGAAANANAPKPDTSAVDKMVADIKGAKNRDAAELVLDGSRDLSDVDRAKVLEAFREAWG